MKKVSVALVGAMCLLIGACSSESDDSSRATTQQEQQSSDHKMGEMVKGEGASIKIEKAYVSKEYKQDAANRENSPLETVKARDRGKFLILETVVQNDSSKDMDLTCSAPITIHLETDKDAEYSPVEDLYKIPGNPECNDQLGPDFDAKMKWIFEFQESHKPERIAFTNFESFGEKFTYIELDKLSDKAPSTSESKGPKPTSASSAPDEATGTAQADSSAATTVEQDNSADSAQSAAAPISGSPAYGNPCSPSQALQPAVGADGTNLVCVLHTPTEGNWVYGPAPSGETVSSGQECTEGEQGGQDEQGRLLMCVNGNWVYGP